MRLREASHWSRDGFWLFFQLKIHVLEWFYAIIIPPPQPYNYTVSSTKVETVVFIDLKTRDINHMYKKYTKYILYKIGP